MNPPPSPPAKQPYQAPRTSKRETIIGAFVAILILGFVVYGVFHMSRPLQGNELSGTIVEKTFIPLKEQRIDFSGRRIEGAKVSNGEYLLKVRVEPEARIYDVPVEQHVYESKKVGDRLLFLKPPSEQR